MKNPGEMPENNIENKENGYKIVHTIRVIRHPEKGSYEGGLTEKGQEDARNMGGLYSRWKNIFGEKVKMGEIVHSGHKRPQLAAELIKEKFEAGSKDEIVPLREDIRVAATGSQAFDDAYKEAIANSKTTGESESDFSNEEAGVQLVVDTDNIPFDAESPSSRDMSRSIAQSLLDLVEKTKFFESNKSYRSIVLSHSGILENFIVDMLKMRGEKNSVSKIGGALNFLEGFELKVIEDTPDDIQIKIRFITPDFTNYPEDKRAELKNLYSDTVLTKKDLEQLAGIH